MGAGCLGSRTGSRLGKEPPSDTAVLLTLVIVASHGATPAA